MNELEKQVLETWQINHRTNKLLMDNLTEESLAFTTSKRGGGTIGHQLAHMYNVRFWKLEKFDKSLTTNMTTLKSTDEKTIAKLQEIHTSSTRLIEQVLKQSMSNEYKVKGFKRGVVPLLGYFIHHEGHHRGNILLTLKLNKFKFPDELKYGIWNWNKI